MLMAATQGPRVYATLNPADKNTNVILTNGNLTYQNSTTGQIGVRATIGKTTGKWSWEVTVGGTQENDLGIATSSYSLSTWLGNDANGAGYDQSDGKIYVSGTGSAFGATYTNGDVLRFELDADAKTLHIFKNNTSQGTYTYSFTGAIYPASGGFALNANGTFNFGATAFVNAPTSGYNVGVY